MKIILDPNRIIGTLVIILSLYVPGAEVHAQNNLQKERARIGLDFFNLNNTGQKIVAIVRTRVDGFFQPVPEANIKFYKDSISEETIIGQVKTNTDGEAGLDFSWLEDTAIGFTYIASLENHPDYYNAESKVEIWKSFIDVQTEEVDSVKVVRVFVGKPSESGEILPVEDINVRIYVQRLFGLLPVSEEFESTDEEGYLDFEFPMDIPGDEHGNLTIVSQVNDHDDFGNLEFRQEVAWGVPVSHDQNVEAKELWLSSSNVPNVMVIAVTLSVLGVIAIILYIVSLLVKIKRIGLE